MIGVFFLESRRDDMIIDMNEGCYDGVSSIPKGWNDYRYE